jgi:hypothetical protein
MSPFTSSPTFKEILVRSTGNTPEKQQFNPFGNPNRSPKHSHGSQVSAIIGPSPPASSQATARSPEVSKQKKTMEKPAANANPSHNPKRKMMEFTPDTCPPSPTAPPSISRTTNAREMEKNFHSVLSVPHRYTPNHTAPSCSRQRPEDSREKINQNDNFGSGDQIS